MSVFDDVAFEPHDDDDYYGDEELIDFARAYNDDVEGHGAIATIMRRWLRAEKRLRSRPSGGDDIERRLALLESHARDTDEAFNSVNESIDNVASSVRRPAWDAAPLEREVRELRQQVEAVSGNVERMRDSLRKSKPDDIHAAIDARLKLWESETIAMFESLNVRLKALETLPDLPPLSHSVIEEGHLNITTAAYVPGNPGGYEGGGTIDMTPRCDMAEASHPFGGVEATRADG